MTGRPVEVPERYRVGGWRVTGLIGSGSWGAVYAAESETGEDPAALKFLPTRGLSVGQSQLVAEMARREAEFSRLADHPRLIRTFATERVDDPDHPDLDGAIVLIMERADHSLADLLRRTESGTPVADAGRILTEVCEGLAAMHRQRRIHGDLKPANVLFMADGSARLADFGLTAELDGTHAYTPPIGTVDYLPPEWWSERVDGQGVAARLTADVWAFGVLAHQVLTGGLHPFPGATPHARSLAARAYANGDEPPRLDGSIPEPWRALIADCLAPTHAARSRHTADALLARVSTHPLPPGRRRARIAWSAAGVAAVAAAALAGTLIALPGEERPPGEKTANTPEPTPTTTAAGLIRAGADVPKQYLPYITAAASRCTDPEVTPALIAAMLKVESGFNPQAGNPRTDEYGIAVWTPSVFRAWAVDGDQDGKRDHMSPPDAIITMGVYVCWLSEKLRESGFRDNLPGLIAAAYRTSDRTIRDAGEVPDRLKQHAQAVVAAMRAYST